MRRLGGNNAGEPFAFIIPYQNAVGRHIRRYPSAYRNKIQGSVGADGFNHKTHFITVSVKHKDGFVFSRTRAAKVKVPHGILAPFAKAVSAAQRSLGRNMAKKGRLIHRLRGGVKVISILVTWMLENSVDSADSMKGRGYGLPGRTAFSLYRFNKRDGRLLLFFAACLGAVVYALFSGSLHYAYFPLFTAEFGGAVSPAAPILYGALCFSPIILGLTEGIKWKYLTPRG